MNDKIVELIDVSVSRGKVQAVGIMLAECERMMTNGEMTEDVRDFALRVAEMIGPPLVS